MSVSKVSKLNSGWRENSFLAKSRYVERDETKYKKARRRPCSGPLRNFISFNEVAADASRLQQKWVSRQALNRGHTQIAGAVDRSDAQTIIDAGADEIVLPIGPHLKTPELSDVEAGKLILALKGEISVMCVTYLTCAASITDMAARLRFNRVQLHGEIPLSEVKKLRAHGALFIVKAFSIGEDNEETIRNKIGAFTAFVDGFLLDTFDPIDQSRGATGTPHDWTVSQRLVASSKLPVILAGGLCDQNVVQAIQLVRPYGVDAHTRLENLEGRKDAFKSQAFVAQAKQAFLTLK